MKKFLYVMFLISSLAIIFLNRNFIIKQILSIITQYQEVNLEFKNSYYLKYNFKSVTPIETFSLQNRNDLMDLYYTIINNGNDTFEFYCPESYENCLNDINELANNPKELSIINGYVHPYNSFDTIETLYNSLGKVNLTIRKTYSTNTIAQINSKVEEIITNEVKDEKDTRTVIKIIHDYIINHAKYDKDRTDKNIINYNSSTAYGVLFEGYGICSGYSDAMAIFLNYYGIPNFKVASENHVWNAVYLDNKWYHLDLTWDDPIVTSGEDILDDTYFLITTEKLKEINDAQHHYDEAAYKELLN